MNCKRTVVYGEWEIRISRQLPHNGKTWLALAEKRAEGVVHWINGEGRTEAEAIQRAKQRIGVET